ncbi:MAG: FlgO family outer membrane protein [Bryobacteraceae bacterium]|jgi:eukaryotic-like serine/threonine-protein kinase
MTLSPGVRLGPYEVISPLGAGGMGEVYQARDTRLDRLVALKTLPAEQMAGADRQRRFLSEAQAASRLNHPNIVTIYDILEQDGAYSIVMEYVAGSTLQQLIAAGPLPLQDAMKYAAEIADALAAAHAAGILHRDLKPANIMIAATGRVKLLDFGLARLIQPLSDATQTIAGAVMGTPAYMSPEQAEGRPLDPRSDIFSFGLVCYEMFTGQRAFWRDETSRLRNLNPAVPSLIEQHINRCLRIDPTLRFQTMADVLQALNVPTGEEAPSIAVLPFVNLSADVENEYFGDGLAEEIIDALTKVSGLRVIARTSAFAFRGRERDLRVIGQRLNVGTVLEGSVRRAGGRIRVTAQLIRISDESHLWSERFDRELTDIFAIQDDISQAIAAALKLKLSATRRGTTNVGAFQSYLKGLYWYQRYTPDSLAKAKESFERALLLDPGYASAYAGLAVFYCGLGALGIRRMTDMAPLAKSAAEKALAIDEPLSEAHSALGWIAGAVEFDWPSAERHFRAAMSADPVPPLVRVRYALYFLTPLRRFEEALAQYRRALETDPLNMMVHYGLAFTFYCRRRYDDAVAYATQAVDLYPDYWLLHFGLGLALYQKGCVPQSIESLETTVRLAPAFTLAAGFLAALHARSGNPARAAELIDERCAPAAQAVYHAALNQVDAMFDCLAAALAERDPYLTRIDAEPLFDPYRNDPRYQALLAQMRLD